MNVTFPDGTSAAIDPPAGNVAYVVAVKIQGRWEVDAGFRPGEERAVEAWVARLRCASAGRYEDAAVIEVTR